MAELAIMLPFLSEYDSKLSNDGSIDPLGLYPLSEALATELCPGIRQRMKNPRFLTFMAIGGAVCAGFDADITANDAQLTPVYQVFEWYIVEGIVRRIDDPNLIQGLPGSLKARQAIADGVHLSAKRYLKTASVFGFHGIYRPLAKYLDLMTENHVLGSFGADLVDIWQKENDLPGFLSGREGVGARWRNEIERAVGDGLKSGYADRSSRWAGWDFIAKYFLHQTAGFEEAKAIYLRLLTTEEKIRRPLLEFLFSTEGKAAWADSNSEKHFHLAFQRNASTHISALLDAILSYEKFSRLIQNGFDHCMRTLCEARSRMKSKDLATLQGVKDAAESLPDAFQEVVDNLRPYGLEKRFIDAFEDLKIPRSPVDWVQALFDHHRRIQANKPPNGKKPWALAVNGGAEYIIDPTFGKVERFVPHFDGRYVNFYRTSSLWTFGEILRVIS